MLITTSKIGLSASINTCTIFIIGSNSFMKTSNNSFNSSLNDSLCIKAATTIAIKAPIPSVAKLIPAPANKPALPNTLKAIDTVLIIGPTLPIIVITGPTAATSPVNATMIALVLSSRFCHHWTALLTAGITLS